MIARGHSLIGKRLQLPLALLFVTTGSWFLVDTQVDADELYWAAQSIASARRQVSEAIGIVNRANREVIQLREALQRELEKRDEIVTARQELAVSKAEFAAARATVMEGLQRRPEYQSAVESRDTAKQLLTGVLALTVAEERPSIVSRHEQASKLVRQLERDALAADELATQAASAYQLAQKNLHIVIQKRDKEIADNPEMRRAERAYRQSTSELGAAKSSLKRRIKEYNEKLDELRNPKKDKK